MSLAVCQILPALDAGGVERGTIEIARALQHAGHRAIVVSAGGRMLADLEAIGAGHVTLPVGQKSLTTLAAIPVLIRRLRALWRTEQIDIVHARSRLPAWIAWLALRGMPRESRPRFVTTVHGPYRVNRYSAIMTRGEAVIAVSHYIRDYLTANYPQLDCSRIHVIPRGVERETYRYGFQPDTAWLERWGEAQPRAAGRRLLTLPGRLSRRKGQLDFVALLARLAPELPVHGLIVGGAARAGDRFERAVRDDISRRGLGDRISLLGHRTDLREILAVSDIAYALPQQPEAFGRTAIEALSLATPVIGYESGGTGEILRACYPAGLVPPADRGALAARTRQLLADPAPVPREHPYLLSTMIDATLAVYDGLV